MITEAVRMQAKAYADAILGVNAQLAALQRDGAVTPAFSRAGTARYTDVTGVLQSAAINVLRNAHYVNGVLQPPLIEPAATNLALWSEDWSNALWVKTTVSVGANGATAPDGTLTADILTRTSTVVNAQVTQSIVLVQGQTYTLSIFAKANLVGGQIGIRVQSPYPNRADAAFDLVAGTIKGTNTNGQTNVSAAMVPFGNGWYRCSLTFTQTTAPSGANILIAPTDASRTVGSFEGFTTSLCDVQVWGAQFEVGAVATSYVGPTNAATASRAADVDAMLAATATGYSRQTGSFLSENFSVGMQVTPANFVDNTVRIISKVTALTVDVIGPAAPDAAQGGRTLTAIDPLPPNIVSIKNQADHNIEVREADDENQYPLIMVCVHSEATGPAQVWSGVQDADIDISSVLVMRGGSDAVKFRNTDYYLRAMKKTTHQFLLSTNTRDTNATRNGFVLKNGKKTSFGHAQGSFMGGQVAGVLKVTYSIRDLAP